MFLGRISCIFNSHKPVRRSVEWNGEIHIGKCRACDHDIRRVRKGSWRRLRKPDAKTALPKFN